MTALEVTLGGIALAPIIAALIQLFKRWGMPTRWAPIANIVLSTLACVVVLLILAEFPWSATLEQWAIFFLQVLILFLETVGVYETSRHLKERLSKR